MYEVVPREVVKMAVATRQQKTCGDGIHIFGWLVAFGAPAAYVNEASSFWPVPILLDLEQTVIKGRQ